MGRKFKWVAKSDDGCYEDESKVLFETKEECYYDMRNAALEKMKWNTEWEDVTDGQGEDGDDTLGYEVHFAPNYIVHKSYSGTYTYKIIESDSMFSYNDEQKMIIERLKEDFQRAYNAKLDFAYVDCNLLAINNPFGENYDDKFHGKSEDELVRNAKGITDGFWMPF